VPLEAAFAPLAGQLPKDYGRFEGGVLEETMLHRDAPPNMARRSKSMAANNDTAPSTAPYTTIELLSEGVMRQPQVCKHQVCNRCGRRFGMVTHRWWGSKFCRRTCKDAYLREITLDRDTIRRWFGFLAQHEPLAVPE
jgi:hypothetical protein